MATTSSQLIWYDPAVEHMFTGSIDLSDIVADVFKCLLLTNSYTPSVSHEHISDLTNEVTGSGYARQSLTGVSLTRSGGVVSWGADNPGFLAVGGAITARYYALAHVAGQTDANSELLGYGLLDTTPGDVVASVTNIITVNWNGGVIFNGTLVDAA